MKGPRKREASQPAYDLRFRAPFGCPGRWSQGDNFGLRFNFFLQRTQYVVVTTESFSLLAQQTKSCQTFCFCSLVRYFFKVNPMQSLCIVNPESFSLLAIQTKKLSNFEVRDGFCSLLKIFLRATLCYKICPGSKFWSCTR